MQAEGGSLQAAAVVVTVAASCIMIQDDRGRTRRRKTELLGTWNVEDHR